MSWLRLKPPVSTSIWYLAPWYAGDVHLGPPLLYSVWTEQLWDGFWGLLGWTCVRVMLYCINRGYNRLQTGSHIHIGCMQSVLVPWYAWAYEATLTITVIRLSIRVDFGVLGVNLRLNDVLMSLLRPQQASYWIPHPYWMYTKCFGTVICCVWAYGAALTMLGGPCRYQGQGWIWGF